MLRQHFKGWRPKKKTLLRMFPPTPLKSVGSSKERRYKRLKRMGSLMEKDPWSPLTLQTGCEDTQRTCAAENFASLCIHALSSKGLIQMLQTQICLNTAPRRRCHFEKENLFETRCRRQGGSLCQKRLLNNSKGPRLAECHIFYWRYNWLWVVWCVKRGKQWSVEWMTDRRGLELNWAVVRESDVGFIWV